MKFSHFNIGLIAILLLVINFANSQVLNAEQCNKYFKIGLKTTKSSRSPQKITYHGKHFKLHNCIGIPQRSSSVQCSFIYRKCKDSKCDEPEYRYYSFTYKKHVKGSESTKNHKCVISRIIKSIEKPYEVSTAEMGDTVLVESKFGFGNGKWKYSYDYFKVAEYKYIDINY